jgi:glycosyltransferase involved in cell wall biosynthesis
MKNVLILSHSFPPVNTISVYRYLSMARYLPQCGWNALVVTPEWTFDKRAILEARLAFAAGTMNTFARWDPGFTADDHLRVEKAPFRSRQELGESRWKELWSRIRGNYLDYLMGDLSQAVLRKGREVCHRVKIDAILSGGDPEYQFQVARQLCREFKKPWVADYRDLVDQNSVKTGNMMARVRTHLARRALIARNNRNVQTASARVTVSDGLAEILRARNRIPVHVIMNGFDPNDFRPFLGPSRKANPCFTVSYGGTLSDFRDPSVFLDGIDLVLKAEPEAKQKMQVVFFGQSSDAIRGKLSRIKHREVIVSGGTLTRPVMLERFCTSDILLFVSEPAKGIATGKLFEYLGSERPILSVPGDGDITDRILAETKAGVVATTPGAVARQLRAWYQEWRETGMVASRCLKEEVYKYTRQSQAQQMAKVLDEVSSGWSELRER